MEKIGYYLNRDKVELIEFEYDNLLYVLSGWWILEVFKDKTKKNVIASYEFDNKKDLLNLKIFNGKTIKDIEDKVKVNYVYED